MVSEAITNVEFHKYISLLQIINFHWNVSFQTTKTWVKLILFIWQQFDNAFHDQVLHTSKLFCFGMCISDFYFFAQLHKSSLPNVILMVFCPLLSQTLKRNIANRWTFSTSSWLLFGLAVNWNFFVSATQDFVMKFSHLNKAVWKLSQIYIFSTASSISPVCELLYIYIYIFEKM